MSASYSVSDMVKVGDDEVKINVRAIVFNTSDVRLFESSGLYLGLECSGIIVEVGGKVSSEWQIGSEVCAVLDGEGFKETVVVYEGQLLAKPGVSFTQAACLPHASCVAWSELFMQKPLNAFFWLPNGENGETKPRLTEGKTLLVHEDKDGICSFAVQLAKQQNVGDTIIAYNSEDFREYCEKYLGNSCRCLPVERCLRELTEGADVIVDTLGGKYLHQNLNILKPGGILITPTIGGVSDTLDFCSSVPSYKKEPTCMRIRGAAFVGRSRHDKAKIVYEVDKNIWGDVYQIVPFVHREVFPFSRLKDAHKLAKTYSGKIILLPDDIYNAPGEEDGIEFSNNGKVVVSWLDDFDI